jgi:uncharacterized membrane protein
MPLAKRVARWAFALFLVAAGINHFWHSEAYVGIVPPSLPWPFAIVVVSGIAEIAIGVAFLVERWRTLAAWAAIALFIVVFPANLYMAEHSERFASIPPILLWLRLPLQAALIAWAWVYTVPERRASNAAI